MISAGVPFSQKNPCDTGRPFDVFGQLGHMGVPARWCPSELTMLDAGTPGQCFRDWRVAQRHTPREGDFRCDFSLWIFLAHYLGVRESWGAWPSLSVLTEVPHIIARWVQACRSNVRACVLERDAEPTTEHPTRPCETCVSWQSAITWSRRTYQYSTQSQKFHYFCASIGNHLREVSDIFYELMISTDSYLCWAPRRRQLQQRQNGKV